MASTNCKDCWWYGKPIECPADFNIDTKRCKNFSPKDEKAVYADVQEVKRGEWIKNKPNIEAMQEFHKQGIAKAMSKRSIYWTCSCCGSWGTPAYRYCPNCGAKMDKE